jgi:hypothetical protein
VAVIGRRSAPRRQLPLRCLLPWDVDDLLTAGRCISGTHEAHSSYRVTPTVMATGQAAGACAALAAAAGRAPREVGIAAVQAELIRQGADLGARGGDGVVAMDRAARQ